MSGTENGSFMSKVIGDKRRWWNYKARVKSLSPNYRTAVDAIERYLMLFVPVDGESATLMFEDLVDLFERAEVDKTPIREIVGANPVEFVEDYVKNYTDGGYVPTSERKRLIKAIDSAAGTGVDGPRNSR